VNLLFLSPTFHPDTGGAESLIDDLASVLVERGHEVTIITESGEPSSEPETRRGARVFRVPPPRASRGPLASLSSRVADVRLRRWHRRLLVEGGIDAVGVGRVEEMCWHLLALRRLTGSSEDQDAHGRRLSGPCR